MKTLMQYFLVGISILLFFIGAGVGIVGFMLCICINPVLGLAMIGGGVLCIIIAVVICSLGD